MIGVYSHLEFSGIGVYCYTQNFGNGCWMKVQLDNSSSNTWPGRLSPTVKENASEPAGDQFESVLKALKSSTPRIF